jgi:general secretion pathway protein C
MKRWVVLSSFLLFIALCGSAAFWALQLFQPPLRQVAAPTQVASASVNLAAAATLFGGRPASVAVASNYQLKGVVVSGTAGESVAILSADGKPAQAVRVNREVSPGVTVREVHGQYVLLNEGGITKRVELPEGIKPQMGRADFGNPLPVGAMPTMLPQTAPMVPSTVVIQPPPDQMGEPPQGIMPPPSTAMPPDIGGAPVIQQ